MKKFENILNTICIIATFIYFIGTILLVLGQFGALFMLNGTLCTTIFNTLKIPAGYAAATTAVLSFILAYIRGDMTPDKD